MPAHEISFFIELHFMKRGRHFFFFVKYDLTLWAQCVAFLITSTNIVIKLGEQYPYKNFTKERLLCAKGTKSGSPSFVDCNKFYAYSF